MKSIIALLCCAASLTLHAQATFISEGKIIFEKKIDLLKEWANNWRYKGALDKIPKYHTTQHILYFSHDKTLFEKGEDIAEKNPYYKDDQNDDDIVYTDLQIGRFVKKQAVYDETILLSDSIRAIQWEMTNDTRVIAGFECHKATAIILDSVFVVAFYTDQLMVNGGPMSFTNLPGMILGIAIPRMNLTIFATKVELSSPTPAKLIPPTEKQKLDYKGFAAYINAFTKRRLEFLEAIRYTLQAYL